MAKGELAYVARQHRQPSGDRRQAGQRARKTSFPSARWQGAAYYISDGLIRRRTRAKLTTCPPPVWRRQARIHPRQTRFHLDTPRAAFWGSTIRSRQMAQIAFAALGDLWVVSPRAASPSN
jgi:hypothetical protein